MLQNNGEFAMLAAAWLAIIRRENASTVAPRRNLVSLTPRNHRGTEGGWRWCFSEACCLRSPCHPCRSSVFRFAVAGESGDGTGGGSLRSSVCVECSHFSLWSAVWRRQRHCCYCLHERWKVTEEPAEAPGGSWRAAPERTNSRGWRGGCCRQGVHK